MQPDTIPSGRMSPGAAEPTSLLATAPTAAQASVVGPRFDPCARVIAPSMLAGLTTLARACGGWRELYRNVGWLRGYELRALNGRLTRHPLYVVSGTRRGTYWLALHWRTEAGRLGGCLVLVRIEVRQ